MNISISFFLYLAVLGLVVGVNQKPAQAEFHCLSSDAPASSKLSKLFPIQQNGKMGFINQRGQIAIEPQFDCAFSFWEGLARVRFDPWDGKWGYIDRTGKLVLKAQFDYADEFKKGLALVKINGKFVYIDLTGKIVFEPHVERGSVRVNNDGSMDMTATFIESPPNSMQQPEEADGSRERLVPSSAMQNGKVGYIDIKTGQLVIAAQFDRAWHFSEGLAAVTIHSKRGYIDKMGKIVIEPQFDEPLVGGEEADSFAAGLALVRIGDKQGYIDKTGKFVWNPTK